MKEINKVHCQDWTTNEIPDKSVQLIIADPPYFEVKGSFDFVWNSFEDYLKDVEKWAIECKRLLADNGTLIWWGMDRKLAYSQIIFDKYFNLLCTPVWEKPSTANEWDTRRTFPERAAERFLIYDNEFESEEWSKTGLERILEEHIAPKHPFALYLKEEFKRAKVTNREIAALFPSKTGGLTGCVSNWLNGQNTITEEQYLKVRKYLNGEYLRKEYEDLRKEYENERRPFNNKRNLTDVFKYKRVYNSIHPTQKPEALTTDLIECCSRVGDLVLVPFAGSGTECAMAARTKRNFIGFDIEQKYADMANKRCKYIFQTPTLF
jgi:site-specific DNA-methyltransferase (adenine-specific)